MRPALQQSEVEAILRRYRAGMPVRQIVAETGAATNTVTKYVRAAGIQRQNREPRRSPIPHVTLGAHAGRRYWAPKRAWECWENRAHVRVYVGVESLQGRRSVALDGELVCFDPRSSAVIDWPETWPLVARTALEMLLRTSVLRRVA